MLTLNEFIILEHRNEHDLEHNINYSIPKIYDANGDLSKRWYVYFSYRNPITGKLTRQKNVYGTVNKLKNREDRLTLLTAYRKCLLRLLKKGYSPYEDNKELHKNLTKEKTTAAIVTPSIAHQKTMQSTTNAENNTIYTHATSQIAIPKVADAFKIALGLKSHSVSKRTLDDYTSTTNNFIKWLKKNHKEVVYIDQISKKILLDYLNSVLSRSSARNRNNYRINLSSVFQVLKDNDYVKENYLKDISTLRSIPKRNRGYLEQEQEKIFRYLENRDPLLLLYIKFISFAFLRPVEVCRLKVGDIDLENNIIRFKAKNKPYKTKILPQLLIDALPDLSIYDKDSILFTPEGLGISWDATVESRRDHFSKRYKQVVKNHFGFDENYGLYSFRHTYITKVYKNLRQNMTPFAAKSSLMLITGHTTMTALEKYLRTIDAEMPADYSDML
ncbi:tyrosine-type recombinase/integrase [Jejudonia soesokkakensis]|uniref:Tyrosine-type recombinase/integrase n=1 Tax=Jejudonia soesokkakensis TaxID=1323432 RepID=A0ABW2MT49_9FLAO